MIHGTNSCYQYHKCRCGKCSAAHKIYQAAANAKYYAEHGEDIRARERERGKLIRAEKLPQLTRMDRVAIAAWDRLKKKGVVSEEPRPFRMFRSPLYDL